MIPRFTLLLLATLLWSGCATAYHVQAVRPRDPDRVVVKVSLKNQAIYVLEGQKPLLVTATSIGRSGKNTPTGHFRVLDKEETKRSSLYGFWQKDGETRIGRSSQSPGPGWHYVGYPLAYWVHIFADYGFHEGPVWPVPRTNGCLHLHPNAASTFYELVRVGTPVIVASTLPEDGTLGANLPRPRDYRDPDRPVHVLTSDRIFRQLPPPQFSHEG
jgi:hypothetical protein